MTEVRRRVTQPPAPSDDATRQLASTGELLIVCDFEGTLADRCESGVDAVDGSMQVISRLASLPNTSVALIADDSAAHLREIGLEATVTVIERCPPVGYDDAADSAPRLPPRKDLALESLLTDYAPSLIFFAGDDETDEPVFAALGIEDIGCKVGDAPTKATMQVQSPIELVSFLEGVLRRRRSCVKQPRRRAAAYRTH